MIKFDHVAITVNNLEDSINFYMKMGYKLENQFQDEEYKWATLKLDLTKLEIFEPLLKDSAKVEHIAYSFNDDDEVLALIEELGYSKEELDIFYGDLNKKKLFY